MSENLTPVIQQLNEYAANNREAVWKLTAPAMGQALKADGTYRTRKLNGDEEFFFKGVRAGARGMVLEFTPLAAAEYTQIEFAQGKAMTAFGAGFESALILALGSGAKTFTNAVNAVVTRARREADDGAVAKPEAKKHEYHANQDWGSF